jgi:hypothetical protein
MAVQLKPKSPLPAAGAQRIVPSHGGPHESQVHPDSLTWRRRSTSLNETATSINADRTGNAEKFPTDSDAGASPSQERQKGRIRGPRAGAAQEFMSAAAATRGSSWPKPNSASVVGSAGSKRFALLPPAGSQSGPHSPFPLPLTERELRVIERRSGF